MSEGRKKILFIDMRDIQCGKLSWCDGEGMPVSTSHPEGSPRAVTALPVKSPQGIRIESYPAEKMGPTGEWEGWWRIIHDQGMYRSWRIEVDGHPPQGNGSPAETENPERIEIVYRESDNGMDWRAKHRSRLEVPGQRHPDGQTSMIDPQASPEERYRFVYCAIPPRDLAEKMYREYAERPPLYQDERIVGRGRRFCLYTAVSADGLSWKAVPIPLMMHSSDTDTSVYYEEDIRKYVMYTRMYRQDRRWVGRSESDDFISWSPVRPVVWPVMADPLHYDVYLNAFSRYPDQPEYRLMFPMFYHRFTERSDVRLYASDDGMAWHAVPGEPVLTTGSPGDWDSDFITGGKDLMPFGNGKMAIPIAASQYPHKYPRWAPVWDAWKKGWAVWPRDRLSAVRADDEGEFWTVPDLPAGGKLKVNFRTGRAGQVRIGLDGVDGRSAGDCDVLSGDSDGEPVTWGGSPDTGVRDGEKAVLHVRMRDTELFSLEWCD